MGEVDREMRLVDIEPLEAALRSVQKRSEDISIQEVLDTLEKYPTVAVVDDIITSDNEYMGSVVTKHGTWHWDHISYTPELSVYGWVCSSCNGISTFDSRYCPNCGAKMKNE